MSTLPSVPVNDIDLIPTPSLQLVACCWLLLLLFELSLGALHPVSKPNKEITKNILLFFINILPPSKFDFKF